jgi:hypothetical protein
MGKIYNIMDIIHVTGEGRMMNTMEKYYTYKEKTKQSNKRQINRTTQSHLRDNNTARYTQRPL